MLVLSREKNETVVIYDQDGSVICEVLVNRITNKRVSLVFNADRKYTILRKEVINAKENSGENNGPVAGDQLAASGSESEVKGLDTEVRAVQPPTS